MNSADDVVEVDSLEKGLLTGIVPNEYREANEETILYDASFEESEDNYVKYQTAQWVLYSLLLILAWGIGALMLLYLPIRRYILRKDVRSRKLYATPDAIVYKVTRPVAFPCFGVLKKEKHVLLPSVADVVIEHGYLQSLFGIYSVRIENAGVRKPTSGDVQIQGIAHPRDFQKAVIMCLSNMNVSSSRQALINEDPINLGSALPPMQGSNQGPWVSEALIEPRPNRWSKLTWTTWENLVQLQTTPSRSLRCDLLPPSGELIWQKLEELGGCVKRVQTLIERQAQTSEPPV